MVREPNILYLLLWHLNQFGWFEIPGLGRFTGTRQSAFIDHLKNTIHPGSIDLNFVESNSLESETMIRNMILETGYSQDLLEEHLANLCQTISESFSQSNQFDFIPFGKLYKRSIGIHFDKSEINLNQDFYGKKPLPITPVFRPAGVMEFHRELNVPIQKPARKSELKALLFALGLLWLIFLCLVFCPNKSTQNTASKQAIMNDTISQIQKEDTILNSSSSQDTGFQKSMTSETSDTTKGLNTEVKIDSNNIKQLNDSIRYRPCVIIVGSFIKVSNANLLSGKIVKQGYALYRGSYGEFNRVGVQFNCFEKNLNEVLEELKKLYHPDSWVLKY